MAEQAELLAMLSALPPGELAKLASDAAARSAGASATLQLTAEPSPSNGDGGITRAQLERWGAVYGTQHRQLRRWIERGRERKDPCPLDTPSAMPSWWERNMEKPKRPPEKVLAAAASAQEVDNSPPQASSSASTPGSDAGGARVEPLDLASVGGSEGDSVEFCRTIVAAVKKKLEEAYLDGTEARIQTLHGRYERAVETLRKQEAAAESKARRRGDLIPRVEVINEVSEAINALKMMREHMAKRIAAENADLPPDRLERLCATIEAVRAREDDVLRNLSAFKTPEDVLRALAA